MTLSQEQVFRKTQRQQYIESKIENVLRKEKDPGPVIGALAKVLVQEILDAGASPDEAKQMIIKLMPAVVDLCAMPDEPVH